MNRALILSGVVVVALGATSLAVYAKGMGPRGPMPMEFSELDLNGDGQITRDEMQARGEQRFKDADTNGDGFLSMDEMKAQMIKEMEARADKYGARMMERKDANGDGQLSLEEMRPTEKRQDKMFSRFDSDGDGVISEAEFNAAKEKMAEHRGKGKWGKRHGKTEN